MGVCDEVLDLVEAAVDFLLCLEGLLHPSLQAPAPETSLALIKYLEQGIVAAQNLLLHLLAENLEGVYGGLIQEHCRLQVDELQVELTLVRRIPLQVHDLNQLLQGHPNLQVLQLFCIHVEGLLQQERKCQLHFTLAQLFLMDSGVQFGSFVEDLLLFAFERWEGKVDVVDGILFFGVVLKEESFEVGVVFVVRKSAEGESAGGVREGSVSELPFYTQEFDVDKEDDCRPLFLFLLVHFR